MDDPDVILGVDRQADRRAHHPVIGQRLRPERIDFEDRRLRLAGLLPLLCAATIAAPATANRTSATETRRFMASSSTGRRRGQTAGLYRMHADAINLPSMNPLPRCTAARCSLAALWLSCSARAAGAVLRAQTAAPDRRPGDVRAQRLHGRGEGSRAAAGGRREGQASHPRYVRGDDLGLGAAAGPRRAGAGPRPGRPSRRHRRRLERPDRTDGRRARQRRPRALRRNRRLARAVAVASRRVDRAGGACARRGAGRQRRTTICARSRLATTSARASRWRSAA